MEALLRVPSNIQFELKENASQTLTYMDAYNPSGRPIAFKFRATNPNYFLIKPTFGTIEPGQKIQVQIYFHINGLEKGLANFNEKLQLSTSWNDSKQDADMLLKDKNRQVESVRIMIQLVKDRQIVAQSHAHSGSQMFMSVNKQPAQMEKVMVIPSAQESKQSARYFNNKLDALQQESILKEQTIVLYIQIIESIEARYIETELNSIAKDIQSISYTICYNYFDCCCINDKIQIFYQMKESKPQSVGNSLLSKTQLYGYRWVVLVLYLISSTITSLPGEVQIPISTDLAKIYDVAETVVTMTATSYQIMQLLLSFYCSQVIVTYGWATSVNIGVILSLIGSALKLIVNFTNFYIIIVAQVLIGSGRPFILNAQATMASSWFHKQSRTNIIAALNILGMLSNIVSAQLPGKWIFGNYKIENVVFTDQLRDEGKSLYQKMNFILFASSLAMVPCLFLLKSQPKTPAQLITNEEKEQNKEPFMRTIKKLFKNTNFLFVFIAFSIYFGAIKALLINIQYILHSFDFEKPTVSMSISIAMIFATLGQAGIGTIVDYFKNKKTIICILMILSISSIVLLYFTCLTHNKYILYAENAFVGISFLPIVPVLMDISCTLVHPIGPSFAVGTMYVGMTIVTTSLGQILTLIITDDTWTTIIVIIILASLLFVGLFFFSLANVKRSTEIHVESLYQSKVVHEENVKSSSAFMVNNEKIALVGSIPTQQYQDTKENQEQQKN